MKINSLIYFAIFFPFLNGLRQKKYTLNRNSLLLDRKKVLVLITDEKLSV